MNPELERAKERYHSVEPPEELAFAVATAVRAGDQARRSRRALRRSLGTALASCACFVLLVNTSPTFAQAVYEMPVLGQLARIFTVAEYQIEDQEHLIDVRLPALENTGHTALEQRINTEISTRIQSLLDEAEERARSARAAYIATGGEAEDFMPVIIDVDYEIKCQGDRISFLITETETQATAFQQLYPYSIDLKAEELTFGICSAPTGRRSSTPLYGNRSPSAVRTPTMFTGAATSTARHLLPSGTTSPFT